MSQKYSLIRNKHQKHPKVNYEDYLYNPGEPVDDISHDVPAELEVELLHSSFLMKRRFRQSARRIRRNASLALDNKRYDAPELPLRLYYKKSH